MCADSALYLETIILMRLQDMLCAPFLDAGFVCRDVHIHSRTVENRKTGASMARRFVQATFCLPPGPSEGVLFSQLACTATLESDSSSGGDEAASSDHEEACAGPLQCLQAAAAISDWLETPDDPLAATETAPHDQVCCISSNASTRARRACKPVMVPV